MTALFDQWIKRQKQSIIITPAIIIITIKNVIIIIINVSSKQHCSQNEIDTFSGDYSSTYSMLIVSFYALFKRHSVLMVSFYTLFKRQKFRGFLMFSGGTERNQ